MMIPIPDLLGSTPFGGDEDELQDIFTYKKSLKELKIRQNASLGADDGVDAQAHLRRPRRLPARVGAAGARTEKRAPFLPLLRIRTGLLMAP